jgi:hypothetical protein
MKGLLCSTRLHPIMERTVIYQEPFNVVYFLYDISSVVFSLDSFACIKVRSDEGIATRILLS